MPCNGFIQIISHRPLKFKRVNVTYTAATLVGHGEKRRVKYIDYTFFKDFKAVRDIESVKPSKEVGPPYVNDIHQFQYNPNRTLFVQDDSHYYQSIYLAVH